MNFNNHGTERMSRTGCACAACAQRRVVERQKNLERKLKYRGICLDCGGPTNGGDGPGSASDYCWHCSPKYHVRPRGEGAHHQKILGFLGTGPKRFMEIRAFMHWEDSTATSPTLDRMMRYGLIKRVRRGVYALSDVWYQKVV